MKNILLTKSNNNLTNKNYWNNNWKETKIKNKELFFDVIKRFLKEDKNKTCVEIGCVPGRFLLTFNKIFKYKISGIDFADLRGMKRLFESNGVKDYKVYQKDFLKFNPNEKFDVVSSFGFIEHFSDYDKIFRKHIALMKKGGTLILEMPNFNYLQGKMHKLLDNKNYARHNTCIMDLKIIKLLCEKYHLDVLYLNYYKTIDFWIDETDNPSKIKKWIFKTLRGGFKIVNFIISIPNKQTSPFIILIAKSQR